MENGLLTFIYFFQFKNEPTAHMVYNKLMAFRSEIIDGQTSVFFRAQTENLVSSLSVSNQNLANWIENFHASYKKICKKFEKHLQIQSAAISLFKSVRIFDPRQREMLSHDLKNYGNLPNLDIEDPKILGDCKIHSSAQY